ncbi:GntR family transcriptional regulator [Extibacter muris]|uniref:GntR family transcriptional regulator n=1 Tax=Extibacter muris TaxID=1796622 RepID=UPI001D07A0BD|nr:GntR family transcriptional regulator [Extibacter muris]MCB6203070.1 GntR family transcriptional regulator [Extibacter muris]MCQ4664293.1 GntR family transcriptional regulator [Extibacter muris]MCQ4692369.1 GntR family transcriptional regulator [Extibacter muris]MCQ4692386.1 GntR family transcriptional regulator [Extibacter muris]
MQSEHQFSNLVYEYFYMRIQFRYYKCGDCLPSIDRLCQEFSVSSQTVKMALQRLRTEGYIDMHNGRSTRIIFQQTEEDARQCLLQYFSKRADSFCDLYDSTRMIIQPLLMEGFRRCGKEDLAYLLRLADGTSADDVLHFFCFVLQKLDNPLAMNLYWETSLFWGLLFLKQDKETDLSDVELMHEEMGRCVSLAEQKEWALLQEELQIFRQDSVGNAVRLLGQIVTPAAEDEQVGFDWRIYHGRPQVCYSLGSRLLHEIYMGCYQNAELLPSYKKMAEQYRVSVSTIRRTVNILRQLGVVRPVNGKGTQIFGVGDACDKPDFGSPVVRRSLAFFVQSFELLAYSFQHVLQGILAEITIEERDSLIHELETQLQTGRQELALWSCLLFVRRHSRLKGIRAIYGRIYSMFQWGYPLKASSNGSPKLEETMLQFTNVMIQSLRENDTARCGNAIKELIGWQFPAAEQYLRNQGIGLDELRLTPAIRLLVTSDN